MKNFKNFNIENLILILILALTQINAQQQEIIWDDDFSVKNQSEKGFGLLVKDFKSGKITYDEWIKFRVYSFFAVQELPEKYREKNSSEELTMLLKEVFNKWKNLSDETQGELRKYGFNSRGAYLPPKLTSFILESAHFQVHYTVDPADTNAIDSTDSDSNGKPDYVESILQYFEDVYSKTIDSMGYTAPPSDSGAIGTNSKYDVYLAKIKPNVLGFASPQVLIGDNPNSTNLVEKNAVTSYIVLRNHYSPINNYSTGQIFPVTIAHEFFHTVQFGYDSKEKTWLMEATATWVEDEIYDEINFNRDYLKNWFLQTYVALDAVKSESNNHWYGSWIFFRYLSEHLGGRKVVREIWERSVFYDSKKGDFSFKAIEDILKNRNTNFKEVFGNFAAANLLKNISPYNYEEGEFYPDIYISGELFGSSKASRRLARHSSRYFKIFPNVIPGSPDEMEFDLTSKNKGKELGLIVISKSGNSVDVFKKFSSTGSLTLVLQNSSQKSQIFAVVVNPDTSANSFKLKVNTKGYLIKLSDKSDYVYGQLKDGYFIYKSSRSYLDTDGYTITDYILNIVMLKYSYSSKISFKNSGGLAAYLSNELGYIFAIVDLNSTGQQVNYGIAHGQANKLAGEFQVTQYPSVGVNQVFFEGELYLPNDVKKGIFYSDLTKGNPQLLVDFSGTNGKVEFIKHSGNSFVAVKAQTDNPDVRDLIYYDGSSVSTFYSLSNRTYINSLYFNGKVAVWSETLNNYAAIKAFDFTTNKLKVIRENNGLDPYSVAVSGDRIVWWENPYGAALIRFWENDSVKTIRTTVNGLFLDDNGVSSSTFSIPADKDGIAWMENDFTLYYFKFSSSSLNSYDLSSYFDDKYTTNYIVKLSGKYVIIDAISYTPTNKTGIYLFTLRDSVTAVSEEKFTMLPENFKLEQNFPNPFNPTTNIRYELPVRTRVQLKIFDLTGREVAVLVNGVQTAGKYNIKFNANKLASGIYFYRLTTVNGFFAVKKMILLK